MRFRNLQLTLALALPLFAQLVLTFAVSIDRTDVSVPIAGDSDNEVFALLERDSKRITAEEDEIDSDPWWKSVYKHTLEKRRGGGGRSGGGSGGGRSGGGRSGGTGSRTSSYVSHVPAYTPDNLD